MKLLVIGSGGREHALVWKLAQSPHCTQMWSAPGNAGTAQERLQNGSLVQNIPINAEDLPRLLAFAEAQKPDLTIVGPDNPLALGIVDLFQTRNLRIWGPNKKAAQFESSKAFSQAFMEKHGIPTARGEVFDPIKDKDRALAFIKELDGNCAVKLSGLALGKGVWITHEVKTANEVFLAAKEFGEAANKVVIQELLEGPEVSLHALCDGATAKLFPTSQDHKRIFDNDQGPNTGGMGTYSPTPFLTDAELAETGRQILDPWLKGCAAEGIDFRGLLYPGIMLTKNGPKVLEFNARFGDPETQVYMMRLESDLVELLDASVNGTLSKHELRWNPQHAVCVVLASGGYPASYPKSLPITGLDLQSPNVKVFHAGTAQKDNQIVTNGGRVLGVASLGPDLKSARASAYAAAEKIHFEGNQYRRDIAAKALPR